MKWRKGSEAMETAALASEPRLLPSSSSSERTRFLRVSCRSTASNPAPQPPRRTPHPPSRRTHSLPHHYKYEWRSSFDASEEGSGMPVMCEEEADGDEVGSRLSNPVVEVLSRLSAEEKVELMRVWFAGFNSEEKSRALRVIEPHLSATHFHWLAHKLPGQDIHGFCPPSCTDFLVHLPPTLSLKILGYLDPEDLCAASSVNRHWSRVLRDDSLWRRLSLRPRWRLGERESAEQLERRRILEPDGAVRWKTVFKERYKLRKAWLSGRCHVRTFEGHTGGVSCVQFDSSRIVSGSHDKTIRVWNIKTNSKWSVMTLAGHSGEVRCLHLEGNRLVSGSTDMTIKVWDLDTQPGWSSIGCKVTMIGHNDTVRCVQMRTAEEVVVSGSYDASMKVWCLKTGACRRTLRGHDGRVLCLFWEDDFLVSGSSDHSVKIWSLDSGACLKTLRGHKDAVTTLSQEGERVISGSLDRTIKLWDISSGCCLSTLDWMSSEGHTGVVRSLQADSWRIVSASDDKTLKVWRLSTGQRLVTLKSHTDGVTCLSFNDFVIVSGSYDKTVKLWDFTVC